MTIAVYAIDAKWELTPLPRDLDAGARDALRLIGPDPQNWVPDRPGTDHNVVIIGGGQSGSALAFALHRAGIGEVSVIDMAAGEDAIGIWRTTTRMQVLRTPKTLPGPGIWSRRTLLPGVVRGTALPRRVCRPRPYPAPDWADYLLWYRRFLGIAVRCRTRLARIEPAGDHLRLHLEEDGAPRIETARKVILANGFAGGGGLHLPVKLTAGLPNRLYAHTAEDIDFAALRGKRIAVIGAAASAFDAAAAALEAGADAVDLYARRPHPRIPRGL